MLDQGDRLQEALVAFGPLHGADLEDPAGLLDDLLDQLPFVDRQRERLFAVDVLAGLHRLDRDLRVPVIGRGDHHRVDVFAIEDLAIVFVGVRLLALLLFRLLDVFGQHLRVDIGQGREIGERNRLRGDRPALIAKADRREDGTRVGRLIAEGPAGRREQDAGGAGGRNTLQKSTTGGLAIV